MSQTMPPNVTIQNVEVRLEVEGDDDVKRFAELFNKCYAQAEELKRHEQESAMERSLGDSPGSAAT